MHGVGGEPVQRAFQVFGHKDFIPVAAQMDPDPEFPTVSFPNPEEGKSALVREHKLTLLMWARVRLKYLWLIVWSGFVARGSGGLGRYS